MVELVLHRVVLPWLVNVGIWIVWPDTLNLK